MSPLTVTATARLRLSSRMVSWTDKAGQRSRWRVPQLRVSNAHLTAGGFEPGDYVLVTIPRRGVLVIVRDPDQTDSLRTTLHQRRAKTRA